MSSGRWQSFGESFWFGCLLFSLAALSFALFLRVTLYSRGEVPGAATKGLMVPLAMLVALVLWYWVAVRILQTAFRSWGRARAWLPGASFLPMVATIPITAGVLGSEAFARDYWIDRSLKVELLLGLPVLTLLLQLGAWVWARRRLTWRQAGPPLAVLSAAFALRFAGMGWGLPFAYQPEEASIYLRWAIEMPIHGQWDPHYFQNPSLLIHLLGFEFMGIFAVARALQFGQDPGELYMVFRGEQDLFYGLARMNTVVLGVATVFVVYLIGRKLWGERAGLVAGALLAVDFLHVRNSQYAVNDVPSTFFLVLSLYFALRIVEEGRWRDYLLAGLMAGLAASTKYNAGLIVVAVAAAHWVRCRKSGTLMQAGALARLGGSAAAAILGFVIGTPFSVLDFPLFQEGFLEQLDMGQAAWSGQSLDPTVWQFTTGAVQGAGLVATVLALAGGVLLVARDRKVASVVLSYPICYLAIMSAMNLFFVRWVVPETPFLALLGAYGAEAILRRTEDSGLRTETNKDMQDRAPVVVAEPVPGEDGKPVPRPREDSSCLSCTSLLTQSSVPSTPSWRRTWVAAVLVVLLLLQPTVFSLRLDWLLRQTDTRQEANSWAEWNLPRGSKIAVESFSLLDQESLAFRATLRQRDIELIWRATMHDMAFYRRNGFDYLAISSFNYDRAFSQPDRYADRVAFYEQLDRELPLLAVFSPRNDGGSIPFALDDLDTPFWYLFSYDRPGPTVKVYRVGG